jgi:hypothetical protein
MVARDFDGGGALIESGSRTKHTVLFLGVGIGSTTPILIPSNSRELDCIRFL